MSDQFTFTFCFTQLTKKVNLHSADLAETLQQARRVQYKIKTQKNRRGYRVISSTVQRTATLTQSSFTVSFTPLAYMCAVVGFSD